MQILEHSIFGGLLPAGVRGVGRLESRKSLGHSASTQRSDARSGWRGAVADVGLLSILADSSRNGLRPASQGRRDPQQPSALLNYLECDHGDAAAADAGDPGHARSFPLQHFLPGFLSSRPVERLGLVVLLPSDARGENAARPAVARGVRIWDYPTSLEARSLTAELHTPISAVHPADLHEREHRSRS